MSHSRWGNLHRPFLRRDLWLLQRDVDRGPNVLEHAERRRRHRTGWVYGRDNRSHRRNHGVQTGLAKPRLSRRSGRTMCEFGLSKRMQRLLFVHRRWLGRCGLLRSRRTTRRDAMNHPDILVLTVFFVARSRCFQKRFPLFERLGSTEKKQHRSIPSRRRRRPKQTHSRFIGRAPTFAQITRTTRGHEVFPGIRSATGTR